MDKGLNEFLSVSESEPLSTHKVYSEKYIELNDFLQKIDPEVSTSQSIEKRVRNYLRIGSIAKNGFEKATEIYNKDSKPFDEALYLLEKGQTPTLFHRYAKNPGRLNKIIVKDMLKDFEDEVQAVAFKYRGQRRRKRELNHFESLNYVLGYCKMDEIKTRNDVIEALMLAQEAGTEIKIHRWDRRKMDNKKVGGITLALFERYYNGNKIELYNKFKDKLADKFGRTMSKSTFYRYIAENKEPIHMQSNIEPDISEEIGNVG